MFAAVFLLMLVSVGLSLGEDISDIEKQKAFDELRIKLHGICVEKIGVSEELIERARYGDVVEDEKLKCYLSCVLSECGVVDDQGNLLYDPIIKVLPNSLFESANILFSYCVPRAALIRNVCEKSLFLFQCGSQVDPKNFYIF